MEIERIKLNALIKNGRGGSNISTTMDPMEECFRIKGQGLYVWVTLANLEKALSGDITVLKKGQYGSNSSNGMLPQETIAGYTGTTPDQIVIIWCKKFTEDEILRIGTAYEVEQKWKKAKKYKRFADGTSTELYEVSLNEIEEFVSEVMYGTKKNLLNYSERPSQLKAQEKMKRARELGYKDFLLGAVMRFGKNFTILRDSKSYIKDENILVISSRPKVFSSIEKDIKSHSSFTGMRYVELKNEKNWKPSIDKTEVVCISKQLLENPRNISWISKLILENNFGLSIIDETQSGIETENFMEKIFPLLSNIGFRVWCSGTPYKSIASGRFVEENSFYYDYIDQQLEKKNGLIKAVTLSVYVPYLEPAILKDPRFCDDEGFKFTKFLSIDENEKFIHDGYVVRWIENTLGISNPKSKQSPYLIKSEIKHSIALCPSVASIRNLTELINSCHGFKAIPATADMVTDIDEVHEEISKADRKGLKTITLTLGRFVEGSTEPRWDSAFLWSDTRSLEKFLQFIFRPTSIPYDTEKEEAYIFDFNPERCLEMNFEHAIKHARKISETDANKYLREYLDCMPIFFSGRGAQLKKVSVDEFIQRVKDIDYSYEQFQKLVGIDCDSIDQNLASLLADKNWEGKASNKIQIVTHDINGKNYLNTPSDSDESVALVEKSDLELAIRNIKKIIGYIPLMAVVFGVNTLDKLMSVLTPEVWDDITGIDKKWLDIVVNNKIIDPTEVNIVLAQL
jgi:hypothetical protein